MFVTQRLQVAHMEETHVQALYQVYQSNKDYLQLTEGTGDGVGVYTEEQMLRDFQLAEWMGRKTLGIFLRERMKLIGVLEYMEQAEDGRPWIGLIMIHGRDQRCGFGSEALSAFLRRAQDRGWHEIRAAVMEENHAALKFLDHLRFERYAVKQKRTPSGIKQFICLQYRDNQREEARYV